MKKKQKKSNKKRKTARPKRKPLNKTLSNHRKNQSFRKCLATLTSQQRRCRDRKLLPRSGMRDLGLRTLSKPEVKRLMLRLRPLGLHPKWLKRVLKPFRAKMSI